MTTAEFMTDEESQIAAIRATAIQTFPGSITAITGADESGWLIIVNEDGLEHRIEATTLERLAELTETLGRERRRCGSWRPI